MNSSYFNLMGVKSPCIECDRKGCGSYHDQCEAYKTYRAEIARRKAEQSKFEDHNAYVKQLADIRRIKEWRHHQK